MATYNKAMTVHKQ